MAILQGGRIEGVRVERLQKPEFSFSGSVWLDSGYLPQSLVDKLLEHLPKRHSMSPEQASDFIARCAVQTQLLCEERELNAPAGQVQTELEAVATKARALLQALGKLSGGTVSTFGAHWDYLAFGSAPPVELSEDAMLYRNEEGRFLGAAWDLVSDLEASARYAIEQCEPSRQARLSVLYAKGLAKELARAYREIVGKLPPYSKGTWFPDFMETLCEWEGLNLKCERALVESAICSIPPN